MTVPKTWLQAQIPRDEWDKLNQRRVALKLTWGDILLPGTKAQLDKLEANLPAPQVEPGTKASKGKRQPKPKK